MNTKELMELVEMREQSEKYYENQNRKAMELVGLWLKWVVLPFVVTLLAYGLYILIRGIIVRSSL